MLVCLLQCVFFLLNFDGSLFQFESICNHGCEWLPEKPHEHLTKVYVSSGIPNEKVSQIEKGVKGRNMLSLLEKFAHLQANI